MCIYYVYTVYIYTHTHIIKLAHSFLCCQCTIYETKLNVRGILYG